MLWPSGDRSSTLHGIEDGPSHDLQPALPKVTTSSANRVRHLPELAHVAGLALEDDPVRRDLRDPRVDRIDNRLAV